LIAGDFNFPKINWDTKEVNGNGETAVKFVKTIEDVYWCQNVKDDTRLRINNEPSLLDLIFTRTSREIQDLQYRPGLGKSDHVVLTCNMVIEKFIRDKVETPKRNYFKINETAAANLLKDVNWEGLFEDKGVNECYEVFRAEINNIVEKCVPLSRKKKEHTKQEWLTDDVIKAINHRDHSWRQYLQERSTCNHKKYVKLRNIATTAKRKSKMEHELRLAVNIKNDKKHFFAYVRNKTKIKSGVSNVIGQDGKRSETDRQAADNLNQAFQSVFTKEDKSCRDIFMKKNANSINYKSTNDGISEAEIMTTIDKLKEGKSPGPDEIPATIIKKFKELLIKPITILFNNSYQAGMIPDIWRCANVSPIFKKGKKDDPLNYRPVSLTCILCKMLETIIKGRLLRDLNAKGVLIDEQYGFRSGRSVTTNLLNFYNTVTEELDNKNSIDIVYFDMAKAFDTVKHSHLFKKMRALEINEKTVSWIENYLSERKQRVSVRGEKSDWLEIFSGVPQGSVIGPLLFLIYINDISERIKSKISIFADDTKMMNRVNTIEDVTAFKQDLLLLEKWCVDNEMKFNIDKCSVMHCGRNNRRTDYTMFGKPLRKTDKEKDLGVIINSDMKFNDQITSQAAKANKILGMINRNFQCMNKEIFTILYSTLVRPHLETAIQVWSPTQLGGKRKLEQVQRRATKLVRELKNKSYDERLIELNLMTTETRRKRGDMIMTYKLLNHLVDTKDNSLHRNNDGRTRGHSLKLKVTSSRTDIRKNFFHKRVVKDWNDLRQETVSASSVESFKRAYDRQQNTRRGCRPTSD
jgi:Reverse transcriptase (RNA-dependent DNA polymerase)/Endonuclease-reverse transcriptase